VTLHFQLHQFDQMVQRYQEMLSHISEVTRNESTDAINA
jgi:hypothetical protein